MKIVGNVLIAALAFFTFSCSQEGEYAEGQNTVEEQNKALSRQVYEEIISNGNLDLADQLVAEDVIEHEEFPGVSSGRAGFKQFFTMFRAAFPDLTFTVEDMIAEGDKVANRLTITGTHEAEFMGMAGTGKQIMVSAIDVFRFTEGKVVEHWGVTDALAMMIQLGAMTEE